MQHLRFSINVQHLSHKFGFNGDQRCQRLKHQIAFTGEVLHIHGKGVAHLWKNEGAVPLRELL